MVYIRYISNITSICQLLVYLIVEIGRNVNPLTDTVPH